MPKRTDIKSVLIIGSGPIVIGQACEFDYSGTQALKALREEGYRIILANSNPATIMTDPELADATYIEPLTPEYIIKIIETERPDAILPTLGGQTALNLTLAVADTGALEKYGVEVIGANIAAINKAEKRSEFRDAMMKIGIGVAENFLCSSEDDIQEALDKIGLPAVVRPSFTLGGIGGGIVFTEEEFFAQVKKGMAASRTSEVVIEEYLNGWKEFELEVMRDHKDNVVIICSIENFDPMGVHTGDSITVAPAQTLTDKQYQELRDMSLAIMREIGVETGGSNIQFAVNPQDGRVKAIEMNPRVSRSSALASKATGFPIAKLAAKLAVGYTLDELNNDITKKTPACFEPTIDYFVTKIPRFTFEKFPSADDRLGTQMKSVGETMAIGRTMRESLQKALRGLEIQCNGWGLDRQADKYDELEKEEILERLGTPYSDRLFVLHAAFKKGISTSTIYEQTRIDPWFLNNLEQLIRFEQKIIDAKDEKARQAILRPAKRNGYSDAQLAKAWDKTENEIRQMRKDAGVIPTYKVVDTCAAEFESYTPYFYSTYEQENEVVPGNNKIIAIIGGGPNRIGQGIEFDYCCVHASLALKDAGYDTIMINSNPETVSTDYDISSRLYFEPVTCEDVLNICDLEKPDGVIVQFGGQTPLNLAVRLKEAGVKIIGTPPEQIDAAGNREIFKAIVQELNLNQPVNGSVTSLDAAIQESKRIGFPMVVRPSHVLGGRAMEIVENEEALTKYFHEAVHASPDAPVLLDHFLQNATEVDVDAVSDGKLTVVGAVMEHIEQAGIHSGDSACSIPPFRLAKEVVEEMKSITRALAKRLKVVGLMNVQYAYCDGKIYLIEVNPRASRTVPFVSKSIGVPLAKIASLVMAGSTLEEQNFTEEQFGKMICVKESVLPFSRFRGSDIILSPEMRSTGEVMGIAKTFPLAYAKAQLAAGMNLPREGSVFLSFNRKDRDKIYDLAKSLSDLGYTLLATPGTHKDLDANGIKSKKIKKVQEGSPNIMEAMDKRTVKMIFITPSLKGEGVESEIRQKAVLMDIPVTTTMAGAVAVTEALKSWRDSGVQITPVQKIND